MEKLEITSENIDLFEELKDATEGSVQISCKSIDKENFPKVLEQLNYYGKALEKLEIAYSGKKINETYSMIGFDFFKACPNLKSLKVRKCETGPSVFNHSTLENLEIEYSWITINSDTMELGGNLSFKSIKLSDTNMSTQDKSKPGQFNITTESKLQEFRYRLGEHQAECFPKKFIISAPELTKISINIPDAWQLILKGKFPYLNDLVTISGDYGFHSLDFPGVEDGSSEYLTELRNEKEIPAKNLLIIDDTTQLEGLKDKDKTNIHLVCVKADKAIMGEVIKSLSEYGGEIEKLDFSIKPYDNYEMKEFDFVQKCPKLKQLRLARFIVGYSIFKHPELEILNLIHSKVIMDSEICELGGNLNLKEIKLKDSNWASSDKGSLSKLIINSASKLKYFDYSLDEDYVEFYPQKIEVSAAELESFYTNIDGACDFVFKGNLSNLKKIGVTCGRYGYYSLDFSGVEDGSSDLMINNRDGKGKHAGEVWVILGQLSYDTYEEQLKHVITTYGGKVQNEIDETVNNVLLSEELFEEWESEELETEELIKINELTDAGKEIWVIWEDDISEYI